MIGLGYVGLPLIVEFALKDFPTVGFEVDDKKVDELNKGNSHIVDVPSENVQKCLEDEKFEATTDFSKLNKCDVIIICVPTPLRKTKDPDMSYILAAGEQIKKYARRGQLVILESTTYPGTTDEVLQPMFEEAGLKLDEDFLLAFSPERVDPGNPQFQTHNITESCRRSRQRFDRSCGAFVFGNCRKCSRRFVGTSRRSLQTLGKHFPRHQYRNGKRNGKGLQRARTLTPGKLSAPRRPNLSALWRFIRDRESADTAFRSTRII